MDVAVRENTKKKVDAEEYNLGRGLVKTSMGGKLYGFGVSNELQVPYHGRVNMALSSQEKLPKDFIKFRIRDIVNGKWLIFPAFLADITDTVTPSYNAKKIVR